MSSSGGLTKAFLRQSIPLDSLASLKNCTCLHPVKLGTDVDTPLEKGKPGRWYGTRLSTVILVKDSGEVTFVERDIFVDDGQGGAKDGSDERRISFQALATRAV